MKNLYLSAMYLLLASAFVLITRMSYFAIVNGLDLVIATSNLIICYLCLGFMFFIMRSLGEPI